MKKIIGIIITFNMFFTTVPVFAQSQEQLQLQYLELLQQLVQLLEAQNTPLATTTKRLIPLGQVCILGYIGSESIIEIQQELKNQGYAITKVDGKIGPETRAAVSAFQTDARAQKIDGLIGEETRQLLSRASVACIGDAGASVGTTATTSTGSVCKLNYNGSEDVATIQQELKNQGYAITKVDGKIGPETRAAIETFQRAVGINEVDGFAHEDTRIELSRTSLNCAETNPQENEIVINTLDTIPQSGTDNTLVTETVVPEVEDIEIPAPSERIISISPDQITAAARSTTAGIPDDTGVFTYVLRFNHRDDLYIPTAAERAFSIDLYQSNGSSVGTRGISSAVSSAQKIIRDDGVSYFRVRNGDTMSLRLSVQPGAGAYYAELGRLSYTLDNAFTVLNPTILNHPLSSTQWRSEVITLLN